MVPRPHGCGDARDGARSSLIDIFIEVIDARIAIAGANSDLSQVVGRKPRLIVLRRDDLADPVVTRDGWQ